MVVYAQLQEKDVQEIANAYGLTVARFEPIEAGASNTNYYLYTKQERYVLTVFDDKSLDYTTDLGALLLILAEHEFATTRLLSPSSGGTHIVHKDKPVMIKDYITGQTHPSLDKSMLRQVGAALAGLHQIPVPDFLSGKVHYGVEYFPLIGAPNIDPEYERWIAKRLPELEQRIQQDLPRGLIHSDLFEDNVLFVDKKLKAIIDFENALHYYKVFDLAMGIVGMCGGLSEVLDNARALVDGYQQVRELEQKEKESLQLFVEFAAANVTCWRFWKYHIDTHNAERADKHRQMFRYAEEIRAIPQAQFSETIFG